MQVWDRVRIRPFNSILQAPHYHVRYSSERGLWKRLRAWNSKIALVLHLVLGVQYRVPNIFNLPHKLHIFGHFLAMVSSKAVHIASVSDLPHSLSKSSQSPTRDGREFQLQWNNVNSLTIKLEGNNDILTTKILVAKSFTGGAFRTWLTNLIRELID